MKLLIFLHHTLSAIFTRVPFSLVSITCCIAGLSGWRLLLLGFFADIVLNLFIIYFWDAKYHFNELISKYIKWVPYSRRIDDDVIQKLRSEREKVDSKYYSAQRKFGNNMDVDVFVNDDISIPSTLPSSAGKTIIVFPNQYNHELKNVTMMAHEFGHANHGLSMQEKGLIISVSIIFFVFSVIVAIFGKTTGWTIFLLALSGLFTIITLITYESKHEGLSEYTADFQACLMLKNLYGEEYMRKAADELLNIRISQCRKTKSRMETYLFANCMRITAYYANDEKFNYLLEKSYKAENGFRDNEFMEKQKRLNSISKERIIQKQLRLYRNKNIENFYITSTNPIDVLGLIFQFIVLATLIHGLSISITIPAGFLKAGFAILTVAFVVLIIKYNIVCLKDRYLMNQLGKM